MILTAPSLNSLNSLISLKSAPNSALSTPPVILSRAKDLWDSTTLITTREILHCVQNDIKKPLRSP